MPSPISTEKQPKRQRRWLRFSLRSFFVFMTVGCILLGFWSYRAERQKAMVTWVWKNGGRASYDIDPDNATIAAVCFWIRRTIGEDYCSTVTAVYLGDESLSLSNPQTTNIEPLRGFCDITALSLYDTTVSDITMLADFTQLEYLSLANTPVSDLSPLSGLDNLKLLDLTNTDVTDLTPLARLAQLEQLNLAFDSNISDEQLAAFRKLHPNCVVFFRE